MFVFILISLSLSLSAGEPKRENVGKLTAGAAQVDWQVGVPAERLTLIVSGPNNYYFVKEFPSGKAPQFRLQDLPRNADGIYAYELRVTPRVNSLVKRDLDAARAAGDDAAVYRIQSENGLLATPVQSGAFTVLNGSFVSSELTESTSARGAAATTTSASTSATATPGHGVIRSENVVTADNAIIQGSECVGLDCSATETFGFATLKLKENNTRILFDDTSTSAGFPNNDWQLTANDSASGGQNKFSIEDITNSKVPFTVTGNSPTNSLFVAATTGNIGVGNGSPGLAVHLTRTDTPAFRMEQTNGGGFTAQTWDIGANEANWFVRDLTGGSRLPFRIRPGAPTSSIDISASGNVGIGTASPGTHKVDVNNSTQTNPHVVLTGQEYFAASNTDTEGVAILLGVNRTNNRQLWIGDSAKLTQNTSNKVVRIAPDSTDISVLNTDGSVSTMTLQVGGGNIGIGTAATSNAIQHSSGAFLTTGGVWTNASSRAYKQDICDLDSRAAAETLRGLAPVTYSYKVDPSEHHVGFIAEDVPDLVATKDRNALSPMDVVAVLTKVVQDQQKTIDALAAKVEALEQRK